MTLSRRALIASLLTAAGAWPFTGCTSAKSIEGGIVGGPAKVGHLLREGKFPEVTREEKTGVVIVGGGIAGLSAGWELLRRSAGDFVLLELHDQCGGNSCFGESALTPYPWGAHYVPVASRESNLVRELFRDLGVISSPDGATPVYREEYLCAEPEDRLYRMGAWSPGVGPSEPLSRVERTELATFHELMMEFESLVGVDGMPAFSIPMELSSVDKRFTDLDRASLANFLDERGLRSEPLRWLVDYCCRDDFGSVAKDTSAWAGIHYFAARRGWAENAASNDVVTWPEGNGWIVRRLTERLGERARSGALVYRVSPDKDPFVEYYDVAEQRSVRVRAESVIIAAPRFVGARLLGERDKAGTHTRMTYRPWMVANIFMDEPPDGPGSAMAWDNVIYGSPSLGYVCATHQQHRTSTERTVLTYYYPISEGEPDKARRAAFETPWEVWCDRIIADLSRAHPGIRRRIERIDVWVWGHGMVSPHPGYIGSEARKQLAEPVGRAWFAHTDLSGLSLFEEAQYRGVEAARAVLGVRT